MLALRIAIQQLLVDVRGQRLRTLLTVLGITWGTVALSLLLAFGRGLRENMRSQLARAGDNVVFAWTGRTYKSYEGFKKGRPIQLDDGDLEALRNQALNLGAISTGQDVSMMAACGTKAMDADVTGVTAPDYFQIRRLPVRPGGRVLVPKDLEERRRVAFVGYRIAEQLTGKPNPVGEEILLQNFAFTIVGVLDPEDQPGGDQGWDSDAIDIPITTFRALTGQDKFRFFLFRPQDPQRNKETVESVRSVLARRLQFDPTDKGALDFDDFTDFGRSADAFMMAISLLLGVSGLLTLVAGGVGVSNIMRVTVEERTHEIGIKMALGAKSGLILSSFLVETLLLTSVGGLIGLVASFGTVGIFPRFNLKQYVGTPSLSLGVYLLILLILGLVGLMAGYGPAKRASRMDPVYAMKL
jgi:putative ABC transport system permease protein